MSGPTMYHYTTAEALEEIIESGVIKASVPDGPDAVFGKGVYGTTMTIEDDGKEAIEKNNWQTQGQNAQKIVGFLEISGEAVHKVEGTDRNLWKTDEDISLIEPDGRTYVSVYRYTPQGELEAMEMSCCSL